MDKTLEKDESYMRAALDEAAKAADEDEVPIGAVIVRDGKIIARARNSRERSRCATHHAEILAIEEACRALGGWRLPGTTLYVTLEPCPMCAGAIINARVERVVYGAFDRRFGAMGSLLDHCNYPFIHIPEVKCGVLEEECRGILSRYFAGKRKKAAPPDQIRFDGEADDPGEALAEFENALRDSEECALEKMADFFNDRADMYEEHMRGWAEHYRAIAGLVPSSAVRLLDIGCGSGLELDRIFETLPDIRVTAIDLSEKMLLMLRKKHPDKDIELICGDDFSLCPESGDFDAAVAVETLHHFTFEKKSELFQKIYRSLAPGGVFLECDYIATSKQIEELAFSELERRRRRDGIPDGIFVHFDTPLTLEHELEAIKAAGFSDVNFLGFLPGDGHTAIIRAVK